MNRRLSGYETMTYRQDYVEKRYVILNKNNVQSKQLRSYIKVKLLVKPFQKLAGTSRQTDNKFII